MEQVVNLYQHVECGAEWMEVWDCGCNSECPECGTKDIEPLDSILQADLFEIAKS